MDGVVVNSVARRGDYRSAGSLAALRYIKYIKKNYQIIASVTASTWHDSVQQRTNILIIYIYSAQTAYLIVLMLLLVLAVESEL